MPLIITNSASRCGAGCGYVRPGAVLWRARVYVCVRVRVRVGTRTSGTRSGDEDIVLDF